MDPRLLKYYNNELYYLRELSQEFAQAYPKTASRLGLQENEATDPYVERILEGFCYLTARIHLKMDSEFPRFSQQLLEVIYPSYLSPTPAMCIVQLTPDKIIDTQDGHYLINKGTRLKATSNQSKKTSCEFRTAHDVDLWPISLIKAHFDTSDRIFNKNNLSSNNNAQSALLLDFEITHHLKKEDKIPDKITLHLKGNLEQTNFLYETLCENVIKVFIKPYGEEHWKSLPADSIQPEGLDDDQALLPYSSKDFHGYRILHEYFSFPERFNFISINNLRKSLNNINNLQGFELLIQVKNQLDNISTKINHNNFNLFCSPAINLIEKNSDRVTLGNNKYEFHVVPDRTVPLDYEIYSINKIEGYTRDNAVDVTFKPLYTASSQYNYNAFFSSRREPRLISDDIAKYGHRSTYIGSEVFVSLVDRDNTPYSSILKQVGMQMTVTNRDLSMLIDPDSDNTLSPVSSLPVSGVKIISGPSHPRPAPPESEFTWRLIRHLGINYKSLISLHDEEKNNILKEMLSIYAVLGNKNVALNIDSITDFKISQVTKKISGSGPLTFGRGLSIQIHIDENKVQVGGAYLLGSVLERFLSRHISLNSFIETHLYSVQRGLIGYWQPRVGSKPII